MKITKSKLKQLIEEEISSLKEDKPDWDKMYSTTRRRYPTRRQTDDFKTYLSNEDPNLLKDFHEFYNQAGSMLARLREFTKNNPLADRYRANQAIRGLKSARADLWGFLDLADLDYGDPYDDD